MLFIICTYVVYTNVPKFNDKSQFFTSKVPIEMSCNYAEGLSPYENKGILGVAEIHDTPEDIHKKCIQLVDWLQTAKHVVVHTGAGISTSAGIPDFRGPKGVWTLEQKGEKPSMNISFDDALPTTTHMALCALVEHGYVHYIVSQNIDGLHLKSGLSRKYLAELHGNMFVEQCQKCRKQFVRKTAAPTMGQKPCGGFCHAGKTSNATRGCRGGLLLDNVLDWEDNLPERDLDMAVMHSTLADINITLGTTLQIIPSGNLPLKNLKHNGKLVICNLQPTKHDRKAQLTIYAYVDEILTKVCKLLGVEISKYSQELDPTKFTKKIVEWTLPAQEVQTVEKSYKSLLKVHAQQRKIEKSKHASKTDIVNDFGILTKKRKNKSED